MTGLYVASNATAIGAQIQLQRNMGQLQEILTRLSTGLRINSGKDDPAGLIASELLKSDITATKQAIQNTQRANSVIAIADSSLGQISNLLNDIRGLINMSANTGAMTPDQIQANQLQVDASLDSIDRIAKTTNYQGQLLLDGSFDFTTQGVNRSMISNLQINAANFGLDPAVDIAIKVLEEAERAQLVYSYGAVAQESYVEIGGVYGKNVFKFEAGEGVESIAKRINAMSDATGVRAVVGAEATHGQIMLSSAGSNNDINLTALTAGAAAGNYAIKFTAGSSSATNVVITEPTYGKTGVIDFQLQMEPWSLAKAVVDESMLGIYTTAFFVDVIDSMSMPAGKEEIRIYSTEGKRVYMLNLIPAEPGGSYTSGPVAIDLDKNGTLNVQYLPTATLKDISDAINSAFSDLFVSPVPSLSGNTIAQSGKVQGDDIRTSNAITLVANTPGEALNNTDIVYVNNVLSGATFDTSATNTVSKDQKASTTISLDGTPGATLTISAKDAGSQYNGIEFRFAETGNLLGTGFVTAKQEGSVVTITIDALDFSSATVNLLNQALSTAGLRYEVAGNANAIDGYIVSVGYDPLIPTTRLTLGTHNTSADLTPVLANDVIRGTVGLSGVEVPTNLMLDANEKILAVQSVVSYSQKAQRATTTIYDGANYLTFTAGTVGNQYGGIDIKIENDTSPTYDTGKVVAAFNEKEGVLHIVGNLKLASYSDLIGAVYEATKGAITVSVAANPAGDIKIATGWTKLDKLSDWMAAQIPPTESYSFKLGEYNTTVNSIGTPGLVSVVGGKVGTNHGSIIYNAVEGVTTAQDVIKDINADIIVGKLVTADRFADSDGTGAIFLAGDYAAGITSFFHFAAMTGGNTGLNTVVTANDLIEFINSHEILREMFFAENAIGSNGYGLVTLFQEAAYYGDELDVIRERGLQFLGPKDSPNIEFRADKKNQELWIEFVNDPVAKADAHLKAVHENAAISIMATQPGSQYDDVAVRFVRLDGTFTSDDNYATYEEGPTPAIAYCDINVTDNGTNKEIGNFILTATNKGDTYNNVDIMVMRNSSQTAPAVAKYDSDLKRLVITINDATVTLQQVMAAIEEEGTFTADFDYSYNSNPYSDSGMCDFTQLLGSVVENAPVRIGNTGNTGGHKGGILTVYLGGTDDEITAQAAIDAISSSVQTRALFVASNYPGSDGKGRLDIRGDTLHMVPGKDGTGVTMLDFKMITSIPKSQCDVDNPVLMIVHLATDADGRSITTAQDLINYFDTLTAEQTRGISVSLLHPPGIANVADFVCQDEGGRGILLPTGHYDDCGNWISNPIVFESANTYEEYRKPSGQVVAVNGDSASYTLTATMEGPAFEGVTVRYQSIIEPDDNPSVVYDPRNKLITISIAEGVTTAAQVKELIETSPTTKGLFLVSLADGSGTGLVTVNDDAVSLSGGVVRVGIPGGALLTGAFDEDPNKLTLESVYEGSRQYVTVRVINGDFEVKGTDGKTAEEAKGKDMNAQMNGVNMVANGRNLSIHTALLDFSLSMSESVKAGDQTNFQITGGGATFQLGPNVVTNQQIRIGIPSINTTRLGGLSGYMYELKSGERADLSTIEGCKIADKIVQEAIGVITVLRGRLGTLQRYTLEPNLGALEDTLEQMVNAEADISNADFAVESSRLTRAQILVQSGTQVLGIANQLPQYAASLIGGR
ncbi:MAG: hypothetical protein FWC43_07430 [Planctomycetaceae bacterium]|nr:hypothetical protein [Planctomycetaceae bacterium]